MATQHLSIRVPVATIERLDAQSRRTGTTRSQLAKMLLEEGLRMAAHPGIVFRDGPTGRRAGLANGPDIWEIISALRGVDCTDDRAIEQLAELISPAPWQIRLALDYYADYPDEIDARIRLNDEEAERGEAAWLREQELVRQ